MQHVGSVMVQEGITIKNQVKHLIVVLVEAQVAIRAYGQQNVIVVVRKLFTKQTRVLHVFVVIVVILN
jgi:hypothetical protein